MNNELWISYASLLSLNNKLSHSLNYILSIEINLEAIQG